MDLDEDVLSSLDYAIASMHLPNLRPGSRTANTLAYRLAMRHPAVRMIGHCDDTRYPVDYEELASAAAEYGVILEVNNSSLSPDGYRGDTRGNNRALLAALPKAPGSRSSLQRQPRARRMSEISPGRKP